MEKVEEEIKEDCKGKLKAENGLQTNFKKGGKWEIIKDLKNYPSHEKGGVDLTIGKNGVNIKNGDTQFTAEHGLVISNNKEIKKKKKEKLLMNLFLSKKNQVITYETIENYVWEGNYVSLESIRSLIRRLRKILDKDFIQIVIDTGYIFKNL